MNCVALKGVEKEEEGVKIAIRERGSIADNLRGVEQTLTPVRRLGTASDK
jgi:hypothetical protein